MRYIIAGYVFVLAVLALYAVQLLWRRRRLSLTVARVAGVTAVPGTADGTGAPTLDVAGATIGASSEVPS